LAAIVYTNYQHCTNDKAAAENLIVIYLVAIDEEKKKSKSNCMILKFKICHTSQDIFIYLFIYFIYLKSATEGPEGHLYCRKNTETHKMTQYKKGKKRKKNKLSLVNSGCTPKK